jgi:hypothetical protein
MAIVDHIHRSLLDSFVLNDYLGRRFERCLALMDYRIKRSNFRIKLSDGV